MALSPKLHNRGASLGWCGGCLHTASPPLQGPWEPVRSSHLVISRPALQGPPQDPGHSAPWSLIPGGVCDWI